MKYSYSFENLPTEGLREFKERFFISYGSRTENIYRVIGKAALRSSLEFRKAIEKEGMDYLQAIGIQISAQAYEAQMFGGILREDHVTLESMEDKLNKYLLEEVPKSLSQNGTPLPGNARSTMILNNLPRFQYTTEGFYYELGKSIHNALTSERARHYSQPTRNDERAVAQASLGLESLIKEAIYKALEGSARRK